MAIFYLVLAAMSISIGFLNFESGIDPLTYLEFVTLVSVLGRFEAGLGFNPET